MAKIKIIRKKPEIFYCGSLIQQNHGESLTGHGFAVWDINTSRVSEYCEIKNSYGYHTIRLENKNTPPIKNLPENLRLRLLVDGSVDASVVKKLQATIRKQYNLIECTINRIVDRSNKSSSTSTNVLDNIHDVEHQNSLIKEFIEENMSIDEDVINEVLKINTKLNANIGEDELPKNINWRPISIKFDNLFSYGEGNYINFDTMDGLYGVFSPNATGKTSAFDAMCFALYDKTPRAFKGSHIMNTRKDKFSCELIIEIDNKQYIIERVGSRKKNGEVKVDVSFYRIENGTKTCLNGEDRRNTNATIRSYVGTYEDFILTALSVQNQNSLFIDTGQSDRKDLLSQFIGLTIFDRLYNLASDEIKEVYGALKSFKKDDFTQRLADLQKQIDAEIIVCKNTNDLLDETTRKIEHVSIEIKKLYEQKIPSITDIDPVPVQNNIIKLKTSIDKNLENIQSRNTSIKNHQEEIDSLYKTMPDASLEELTIDLTELKSMQSKHRDLQSKINACELHIANKQEKLEKLKEHKYDPNCEFCMNNVFVKDALSTQSQYDDLIQTHRTLLSDMDDITTSISQLSASENLYNLVLKSKNNISKLEDQIQILKLKNENDLKEISIKNDQIKQLEDTLVQYENNKLLIEQNHQIQNQIDVLEDIKSEADSSLMTHQKHLRVHDRELVLLRSKRDELLKTIKEAEELETVYEAYETYLSVIGRDGLPYHLISDVIPTIQTEVNQLLNQMVDFSVSLEVDGKNINGKILYDDDRTWPLELASGMEKFISSMAIRVALMNVSNLPKSNFLVIDEGLGVLDSDNLASMSTLFDLLKTKFDFIILISHLDVVRDIADNLLEIKRDDGFSYIQID